MVITMKINIASKLRSKRTITSFLISALAIYFLATIIDINKTVNVLKSVNLSYFILAMLIYYSSIPIRGYRWKLLLENVKFKGKLKDVTEIWFLAYFINCLVPAKLGDIYRGYLIRKNYKMPISRTLGTILTKRVADIIFLIILLTLSGYIVFGKYLPSDISNLMNYNHIALFLGIFFLICLSLQKNRIISFIPQRLRIYFLEFELGFSKSITHRNILQIIILTIICWSTDILRLYFVAVSLSLAIPIPLIIFIALCASLLSSLPITPAGLGAVELAMVSILVLLGYDINISASIAILDRIINFWSFIVLGIPIYFLSDKK